MYFIAINIFIYANDDYKIKKVMEMYGDTETKAKKNVEKSDKNRASYYQLISGKNWGGVDNYALCIDSSIGPDLTDDIIVSYIEKLK